MTSKKDENATVEKDSPGTPLVRDLQNWREYIFKMASKSSKVWDFFTKIDGGNITQCDLCKTKLSFKGGSTSSMRNHLKAVHKKTALEEKPSQRQETLHKYQQKKTVIGKDKYQQLNRSLALACALDLRPLSLTMGKGFRNFCHLLNPDYVVPCADTVTKNLLLLYQEQKAKIIELIANCKVSLTTDLWTSIGSRSYITLTAHFITEDWQFKTIVLATRPVDDKHTGENIANCLLNLKTEFKIEKLVGIVTDNAANMKKAGFHLDGLIHWFCFSHGLQLAVEEGLKLVPVKRATGGAKAMVGHFSRSTTATAELKKQQNVEPPAKPFNLIQSVPTRWNSTFFMAERLLKLRLPVFAVLMNDKITKPKDRQVLDLNDTAWKVLEDIVPVLRPLKDATEALTKEEAPSLSQVYVILYSLVNQSLAASDDDSPVARNLKSKICDALKKRFDLDDDGRPNKLTSPAIVATFLDPRYKSLKFLTQVQKQEVVGYVEGLVPEPTATASNVQSQAEDQCGHGSILDCLDGDTEIDLTQPAAVHNELQNYISEPVRTKDPMEWWKMYESR